MFNNIENLKLVSSSRGKSKKHSKMQSRKMHSFNFRVSGEVSFCFEDKIFSSKEGQMIFLPQGSSYELTKVSDDESQFVSISFYADIKNAIPTMCNIENFSDAGYIISHFPDMWNLGSQSDKYKCFSLFYNLLAYLSNIENADYAQKRKYEIIEPAVKYLKTHLYDPLLKIDNLHLMCKISDTYFRQIFTSKFGTTPRNYVVNKRIAGAESIINEGNFDTISEVAAAVGYNDPLYFSRAFKRKYGISPSEMNKEIREDI